MPNPFQVGQPVHGFAGGYFGRDSYSCRTVEAVGFDWIVTRNSRGDAEFVSDSDLRWLWKKRDDRSYCAEECEGRDAEEE